MTVSPDVCSRWTELRNFDGPSALGKRQACCVLIGRHLLGQYSISRIFKEQSRGNSCQKSKFFLFYLEYDYVRLHQMHQIHENIVQLY